MGWYWSWAGGLIARPVSGGLNLISKTSQGIYRVYIYTLYIHIYIYIYISIYIYIYRYLANYLADVIPTIYIYIYIICIRFDLYIVKYIDMKMLLTILDSAQNVYALNSILPYCMNTL